MPQPSEREIEVFNIALDLPASQRPTYLDEACAGDAVLRQRVEELLLAGETAGSFLDSPVAPTPEMGRIEDLPKEKSGDRIGRYKILQQIGEGGCGTVYMAEQMEPVHRRVALKVIKPGMDTKNVIARFEAERQALALMDHPNIAMVLDAGATDAGRPYFVMELVHGIKITDYCDQNNLSTRERLDLFVQVCRAIQHAHQKGIIHRDIKPSNILVTMKDGIALPKVIDFGIAKATHGKLADQTAFTAFEQFIGTPAYMSPEQAEMSSQDIDTRSDIYSLGVLLYELLTGQTPFDAKKLLQAGLDEIRRTIREEEPARPSTRLSTMLEGELTTTARRRQTEPPKLIHLVRGDLDWIVMKALEKNRTRRYETANGLAADILRHFNDEPVQACPPGKLYKFLKLVRRNKFAFIATGIVIAVLIIGFSVSMWMFLKKQQARRQAQEEAVKSRQVADFLQEMLAGVGPEVALGHDTSVLQEIMRKTKERLNTELKDQPEVESELRTTLAETYLQLGNYADAESEFREAVRLEETVAGADSTNVMKLVDSLTETMINRGELSAAEPMIREELARSQRSFGGVHPAVATCLENLADLLWQRGDLAGADQMLRQALSQWRVFQDPKNISVSLNDLGLVQLDRGDMTGAEASFRESLDIRKSLLPPGHPALAMALNNLAMSLWYKGDLTGAEAIDRQTLEMERGLYHDGSANTAATLNNLAMVLRDRGDFAAAEPLQREALAMVEKASGKNDPKVTLARDNLATLLRRRGATEGNVEILREALDLSPSDPRTADAFASLLASPFLIPLTTKTSSTNWQWTSMQPDAKWIEPDYSSMAWMTAPEVYGTTTHIPRTFKNPVNSHTNLWLRREFQLSSIPTGEVIFRISRNHDAQLFLNGIEVMPTADWSDTDRLLPATATRKPELNIGRNILCVHCQDADGGAPIDVEIFATRTPSMGLQKLIGEFGSMIDREPQRAELFAGRAAIFARLGHWREAATDLSNAVKLEPAEATGWFELAPLLLETNDLPGYSRCRHQALEQFAQNLDPAVAARIAGLSLLVPADGEDLEMAGKLADYAAAAEYADGGIGFRQLVKGLAEYRRGRFANSVSWMDKVLSTASQKNLPGWSHERERNFKAIADLVTSMAKYQMHDPVAARKALDQGSEIIQTQFPSLAAPDMGPDWPDWLIAQIFLQEANTLIR